METNGNLRNATALVDLMETVKFTYSAIPLKAASQPLNVSLAPQDGGGVPLVDGEILQWKGVEGKFKPTALASVATSGDYNDLINAPSAGDAPVTSVNTETGDVSLGIQDMDDFELAPPTSLPQGRWANVITTGSGYDQPGNALVLDLYSGGRVFANNTDSDGADFGSLASAAIAANGGNSDVTFYCSRDGGNTWTTHVAGTVNDNHSGDSTYFESVTPVLDVNTNALRITFQDPTLSLAPLAEGDILQWNDAAQKFKPTQLDYSQINNTPAAPARITPSVTTAALAVDATETGEITGTGATGFLISVQTDTAAWIRVYCSPDAMTADASRDIDTDPAPGSGVLFEALYSTFTEKPITPGTTYFNLSGLDKLYYRITNRSAIADTPITVTFKLLPME